MFKEKFTFWKVRFHKSLFCSGSKYSCRVLFSLWKEHLKQEKSECTHINKTNNHLSPQNTQAKPRHMLDIQVYAWDRHKHVPVLNLLMGCLPQFVLLIDNIVFNNYGETYISWQFALKMYSCIFCVLSYYLC